MNGFRFGPCPDCGAKATLSKMADGPGHHAKCDECPRSTHTQGDPLDVLSVFMGKTIESLRVEGPDGKTSVWRLNGEG